MRTALVLASLSLAAGMVLAQDTTQTKTTTTTTTNTAPAPELKTYKGTLMDAACAMSGTATTTTTTGQTGQTSESKPANPAPPANAGPACPVSASTAQFAMKLEDGHVVRFDAVGDVRAQETIKDKKSWSAAAGSGKPIRAKASGMLSGDTLTVVSLH